MSVTIRLFNYLFNYYLRSFGRGLSGPQAAEVTTDPHGSWAATNLTVHSSNSFLGPSFLHRTLGSYSWIAFFGFCFFAFSNLRKVHGFWSSLGGHNYGTCCCMKTNSMFAFLSVLKTRRRYVNSGRLLADRILQHIGSERSDPIREMHFLMFFCFEGVRVS